jgi:hypothetical protein
VRIPIQRLTVLCATVAYLVVISRQANAQDTTPPPSVAGATPAGAAPAPAPPPPPAGNEGGDHPAANSVYAEGLGEAIIYSVNYERIFVDQLAVRAGIGYFSVSAGATAGSTSSSSSSSLLFIPITVSWFGLRSGKHSLELGVGTTLLDFGGSAKPPVFPLRGPASPRTARR